MRVKLSLGTFANIELFLFDIGRAFLRDRTAKAFSDKSNLVAFLRGLKTHALVRAHVSLPIAAWVLTGKPLVEGLFSQPGVAFNVDGVPLALPEVSLDTILSTRSHVIGREPPLYWTFHSSVSASITSLAMVGVAASAT